MSLGYNQRLKPRRHKGLCGDPERIEANEAIDTKCAALCAMIQQSTHTVVFTGAGISTSCGIPDFRGPNGVWTMERKGTPLTSAQSIPFDSSVPSPTHLAIVALVKANLVHHVISQNVDGLHLRSGLPRTHLSELHGNIFTETCSTCLSEYQRDFDVGGMGCKETGRNCECGGKLRDTMIDWDTPLPEKEFADAISHCKRASLVISLGTSLRIRPAGNLPARALRRNGKSSIGQLAIVNLQVSHLDRSAKVRIFAKCDDVMNRVMMRLGLQSVASVKIPAKKVEISDDGPSKEEPSKVKLFEGSQNDSEVDVEESKRNKRARVG